MKNLWIIITVGLIARFALVVTTYHSDMQVFEFAGKLVASGNIFNLYDFSSSNAVLNYPPAIYLYHGLFRFIFGLSNPLLLKLPYLIFDLLIGFIFLKLFTVSKDKLLAFTLWMFNPVSLYATYMMGQFDIIPTFFIVLSIYFVVKNKLKWSALTLGFGIAFKIFPIFLVIPLVILGKNYLDKLKLFFLATLPYLLSIAPYIFSHSFRATALFANQSSKSLYASIAVSGGESIILFPAFLLFFYFFILGSKIKLDIWKLYLIPFLLFFIFTHYHPQWLIWVTPLLILELVASGFKNLIPILIILISWVASLFFFDPSLTVGMFAPIAPILQNTPSIWTLLHIDADYNLYRSLLQTIFTSASLFLIYQNLSIKKDN